MIGNWVCLKNNSRTEISATRTKTRHLPLFRHGHYRGVVDEVGERKEMVLGRMPEGEGESSEHALKSRSGHDGERGGE